MSTKRYLVFTCERCKDSITCDDNRMMSVKAPGWSKFVAVQNGGGLSIGANAATSFEQGDLCPSCSKLLEEFLIAGGDEKP